MVKVKLKSIIASSFYESHKDIKNELHTHYWFKGGRGSTKSSFMSAIEKALIIKFSIVSPIKYVMPPPFGRRLFVGNIYRK